MQKGLRFPIYSVDADISVDETRPLLLWDHIFIDSVAQDAINAALGRQTSSYDDVGSLRMFQGRDVEMEKIFAMEKLGDRAKYFIAIGEKAISWVLAEKKDETWEVINAPLLSTGPLTFWTGCQIPGTLYFLVTEADGTKQLPVLHGTHTIPTQTILLYSLNPKTLMLEKVEGASLEMATNSYHHHPCHWRDPHPVLKFGTADTSVQADNDLRYYFCGVDADSQACIGVLTVKDITTDHPKIVFEEPFTPGSAGELPELEVPVGVQTPYGEYLITSSTKNGVSGTYCWVKPVGTTSWQACNGGEPLSFGLPEGYTLYAAKCHLTQNKELVMTGWVAKKGFIYAQSNDYSLKLEGQTVTLG